MGFETAAIAALGVREERKRRTEELKKKAAETTATLQATERMDDRTQRIGRSALIATSPQGILNPERTGRRRLTAQ